MSDIVDIGLKVDSSSVKKGTGALNRFGRQAGKTERATDKMRKSISRAGLAFKVMGVAMAGVLFSKIIRNTIEQEQAFRQVEQAIKSTGGAAGLSAKEIEKMASGFQNVTTFGDEAILRVQSKILTFTGITKENFGATTEAVLDLATRMEGDLNGAVVQLGKVLNDPITNLSALSRVGIQFTETDKAMIKHLAKSGDLLGAQSIILKELNKEFGGSARAARDTFGGALKSLGNAFGDLLEGKSGLNEAKTRLEGVTKLLQDPKTVANADKLVSTLLTGFTKIVGSIPKITAFLNRFFGSEAVSETGLQREIRLTTQALEIQKNALKDLNRPENSGLPGPLGSIEGYRLSVRNLTVQLAELKAKQAALGKSKPDLGTGIASVRKGPTPAEIKAAAAAQNIIDLTKAKFARMHELALEADATDSERAQLKLEFDLQQMQTDFDNLNLNETQKATLREQFEQARIERAQMTANKLGDIEAQAANRVLELENKKNAGIRSLRAQSFNEGVGLLQMFAGKSKVVALLLTAIQTAQAVSSIQSAAAVAAANVSAWAAAAKLRAMAEGGIIGGPAAVAAISALEAAELAKIGISAAVGSGLAIASGVLKGVAITKGGGNNASPTFNADPGTGLPVQGGQPFQQQIQQQQIQRVTNVTLSIDSGGIFTGNEVRTLIEAINEQVGDGVKLAVNA